MLGLKIPPVLSHIADAKADLLGAYHFVMMWLIWSQKDLLFLLGRIDKVHI